MTINPIQGAKKAAGNVFNRTLGRLFGAGLNKGAESPLTASGSAQWAVRSDQTDWRVKLTLPQDSDLRTQFFSEDNSILAPLRNEGGVVFPLTPSVIIQHQASYNPLAVTHSNYPFYAYQNSETSALTIVGEFPVQNYQDAQAWVATLHFFRSVTKMFFGGDNATRGNPPPILKLNGYGNYVFKNVPVVVTNFTVELTQGVDYISTAQNFADVGAGVATADALIAKINKDLNARARAGETITQQEIDELAAQANSIATAASTGKKLGWAPTSSIFTVQIQPVYSRDSIKNFSMKDFVKGNLNNFGGNGNKEGIGFI